MTLGGIKVIRVAKLEAERDAPKEKAANMFDALYRDKNKTERGRTTPSEMQTAYYELGVVLGNFGGPYTADGQDIERMNG